MPTCPRCQKNVKEKAVRCPHCQNLLKAYGHPGIPLHQSEGDTFLCESCTYHVDNSCDFPKYPYAKTCTLYQDVSLVEQLQTESITKPAYTFRDVKLWCQRNRGILIISGIILVSIMLALSSN